MKYRNCITAVPYCLYILKYFTAYLFHRILHVFDFCKKIEVCLFGHCFNRKVVIIIIFVVK